MTIVTAGLMEFLALHGTCTEAPLHVIIVIKRPPGEWKYNVAPSDLEASAVRSGSNTGGYWTYILLG